MGCFLACFGSSEHRKSPKRRYNLQKKNTTYNTVQPSISEREECSDKKPIRSVSGDREPENQLSIVTLKKVTFDTNVKTYDPEEDTDVISPDSFDEAGVEKIQEEDEEGSLGKIIQSQSSSSSLQATSVTSSSISYPPNHRYQNCRESDDEVHGSDDLDDFDSDIDLEDDDNGAFDCDDDIYDDSDNNSITESRVFVDEGDPNEADSSMMKPTGAENTNARDRSVYVHSVLNPVENLTQWRALKAKRKPQLKCHKENSTVGKEPPSVPSSNLETTHKEPSFSFKLKSHEVNHCQLKKSSNQEMAVDASLSSWLTSLSESTPVSKSTSVSLSTITPDKIMSQGSNSPMSKEDRPILGALTLEEIKQFSASSSPRKSPSRSPDEMPIIGTVGTHWSHLRNANEDSGASSTYNGIPNTTSKYTEDKKVNWHSTPFETRLERALNNDGAAC